MCPASIARQHPSREQRDVARANDGAVLPGEDEEGDGGVAGGAQGCQAEDGERGLGPVDQDAAGGSPVVGVEPEEAVHDPLQHRAAGFDHGGVERLGWGEGEDRVGGVAAERRLQGERFVVVPGDGACLDRVGLEDAVDGLRRDEEAEGLALVGGREVVGFVGAGCRAAEAEAEKKVGG